MTNREVITMDILDFISGVMNNVNEDDIQNLLKESDVLNAASTVSDGEEFMFCGIPFIRLGEEQGGILCITKQHAFRSSFNDTDNNNYIDSIARYKLLKEFLPQLDTDELLPFEMNLVSAVDNSQEYGVCTDYVGILTEELYRKYRRYVRTNGYTWLCTPYSVDGNSSYASCVDTSGYVYKSVVSFMIRCRPACIFKKPS